MFDVGLNFNYHRQFDVDNISPDKAYAVVHFSETGEHEERMSKVYLCAFVRMSDGCVVRVAAGEQCGGGWSAPSQWLSPLSTNGYDLTQEVPSVDRVYKDYALGRKDLTKVSSPKILSYLLEGTTFDNVLTCDPPGNGNKKVYASMLELLERDGDAYNFLKLRTILNSP